MRVCVCVIACACVCVFCMCFSVGKSIAAGTHHKVFQSDAKLKGKRHLSFYVVKLS
jgi:hypothetical protein